jgi:hypothetical protein
MTWQMGFTNMAQAFTMAENLFRDGGRKAAQSQLIVITDGKPSFKYQTEKAANDLKDANVHINMIPVHPHVGSDDVTLMKKWASVPWKTHVVHVPGIKGLTQDVHGYATQVLVQFCPRAMSPKLEKLKNKARKFKLVVEKRDCLDWWWRLHRYCHNRRCNNLADCAAAARRKGAKYFVHYGYRNRSYCYAHKKNNGKCGFKKRPWMRKAGWTRSVFNVYALEGAVGSDGAKKSMLLAHGETHKEADEDEANALKHGVRLVQKGQGHDELEEDADSEFYHDEEMDTPGPLDNQLLDDGADNEVKFDLDNEVSDAIEAEDESDEGDELDDDAL